MNSSSEKSYKCTEAGCTASYTKAFKLEIHKRKHTGERPFVCDIEDCTKSFTNVAHLKRHKCFVHERSSEILCTVSGCGRVFNNKYSLKKHMHQQHDPDNNMFKCAECMQEFKKKRQLARHLYSHKGSDVLKCTICNISFGSLHLYNKHKSNHKTYTCDCGVVFNKWSIFCEHRRTSCTVEKVDHKCIICNKVFTTKKNLKSHSLIHLEESQKDIHRCPYLDCNRSYKYKKNLNYHISVYHEKSKDELEIHCTEEGCKMFFKSKKNLRQHVLNIHKGLPKNKKDRKPRKDKGKKKKCMASILSGVPLTSEEHAAILNSSELTATISDDHKRYPENVDGLELNTENVEDVPINAVVLANQSNTVCNAPFRTTEVC